MSVKAKILLSIAILREFHSKIKYYRNVVRKNLSVYREYREKISGIDSEKALSIDRELKNLDTLDKNLNTIEIFLEHVILRLETLAMAGNIIASIHVVREVAKQLKQNMSNTIPIFNVLIDRLDEISRSLYQDMKTLDIDSRQIAYSSNEAKKIVNEAKKVAGIL
ncbi:hypothetical protein Igag_0478 [Ignisphaera aggregans DSM 17230]|uniref:Uncharacterized protein n=1 Tax=Ignisphaera aggregans (strain DSM 17230 / JCM 13409 / AQ1.S1) TaxID=583356 RepID=E0SRP1_IGNAA|nr:hypothetical protein Igag_0478 [Ignisphaera aggregans DSM 17230]